MTVPQMFEIIVVIAYVSSAWIIFKVLRQMNIANDYNIRSLWKVIKDSFKVTFNITRDPNFTYTNLSKTGVWTGGIFVAASSICFAALFFQLAFTTASILSVKQHLLLIAAHLLGSSGSIMIWYSMLRRHFHDAKPRSNESKIG